MGGKMTQQKLEGAQLLVPHKAWVRTEVLFKESMGVQWWPAEVMAQKRTSTGNQKE